MNKILTFILVSLIFIPVVYSDAGVCSSARCLSKVKKDQTLRGKIRFGRGFSSVTSNQRLSPSWEILAITGVIWLLEASNAKATKKSVKQGSLDFILERGWSQDSEHSQLMQRAQQEELQDFNFLTGFKYYYRK